jgi:hypothetical protein
MWMQSHDLSRDPSVYSSVVFQLKSGQTVLAAVAKGRAAAAHRAGDICLVTQVSNPFENLMYLQHIW